MIYKNSKIPGEYSGFIKVFYRSGTQVKKIPQRELDFTERSGFYLTNPT